MYRASVDAKDGDAERSYMLIASLATHAALLKNELLRKMIGIITLILSILK
jgi:hypothetical protein